MIGNCIGQIAQGPRLPIRIRADVVVPSLVFNVDLIDFGELVVGEAKVIGVQLHNPCSIPVTWRQEFLDEAVGTPTRSKRSHRGLIRRQREKTASSVPVFEIIPRCGVLQSGERVNVNVSLCFIRVWLELVGSCLSPRT